MQSRRFYFELLLAEMMELFLLSLLNQTSVSVISLQFSAQADSIMDRRKKKQVNQWPKHVTQFFPQNPTKTDHI